MVEGACALSGTVAGSWVGVGVGVGDGTKTGDWHFGHGSLCPISDALVTFSLAWQDSH